MIDRHTRVGEAQVHGATNQKQQQTPEMGGARAMRRTKCAFGQLPCCTSSRPVSCSSVSTACCGSGIESNSLLMR